MGLTYSLTKIADKVRKSCGLSPLISSRLAPASYLMWVLSQKENAREETQRQIVDSGRLKQKHLRKIILNRSDDFTVSDYAVASALRQVSDVSIPVGVLDDTRLWVRRDKEYRIYEKTAAVRNPLVTADTAHELLSSLINKLQSEDDCLLVSETESYIALLRHPSFTEGEISHYLGFLLANHKLVTTTPQILVFLTLNPKVDPELAVHMLRTKSVWERMPRNNFKVQLGSGGLWLGDLLVRYSNKMGLSADALPDAYLMKIIEMSVDSTHEDVLESVEMLKVGGVIESEDA